MKNLIIKTKLMAIVLVGLWVIPASTTFSQDAILDDIAGRTTISNSIVPVGTAFYWSTTPTNVVGRQEFASKPAVAFGSNFYIVRSPSNTNSIYWLQVNASSSALYTFGWQNPSTLNTNTARLLLNGSTYAIFDRIKPPTTYTLQTIYNLDGQETTLSSTTPNANSSVTLTPPNLPNTTFLYWQLNGVNQSATLPYTFTITANTIVKYFYKSNPKFNFNVSNPSTNTKPSVLSVWSSVQGNILLGHVLDPGETFNGSVFAQPGETFRVVLDGVLIHEYTYPIENPSSTTLNYVVPEFLEPDPEPSPTPISAEPPDSIFEDLQPPTQPQPPTNNTTPPNPNPNPPTTLTNTAPNLGGGNTTTGNTIPNPFGTFNPTNAPTQSSADLYGVIKQAIQDAQGENGPTETQPTDTTQLSTTLSNNASNLTNNLSSTTGKLNQLTGQISALSTNVSSLANSFSPDFPNLSTTSTLKISIPLIGSFNLNINELPGITLFRNLCKFFLWLMAIIFSIHIIRKAIA